MLGAGWVTQGGRSEQRRVCQSKAMPAPWEFCRDREKHATAWSVARLPARYLPRPVLLCPTRVSRET